MRDRAASEPEGADDLVLMRRFQGGDEVAYEVLVRRHLDFVIRHARRYVGDDPAAEDVAQEVFLRVYRSVDLYRERRSFTGWLATITTRLALNELRTRRRKRWTVRSALEDEGLSREWRPGSQAAPTPDDGTLRREKIEAVWGALEKLPDRQREAIYLQRFEGWGLEEVGEAMGLTVPAVKSLLHRARGALMKHLEPFMRERDPHPSRRRA